MNYKIIYFVGDSFDSLADFRKACLIDIDRTAIIINYDTGQKIPLYNLQSIIETELEDFGKLLKITTDTQVVYMAAVLFSFKGGMAVAHNVKTASMAAQLKKLFGFEEDGVEHYGPYEVRRK